ncbi:MULTISPECIES: 3'-5' exonuclease [unclassified Paenibacillus]|uniref:3'-5' exonuclease n=1 Tax=unclassified Paenibacillus TaxID=185978 RepID=UPI001AE2E400|nr:MULTISPECIES: 3'-5' exonuclease [unclassified Paenibacillus]MBP1153296.1 superfamily I DNA/RNA helicase [Paenibacillus sp. PvP091]MBP1171321.1 superfamily I DNA/RNA helicase [Paenibacillus sp. PvR098]MBP2442349.1 superfamily I DNA/RNA helicase [Paenibacillus sp. PvP052]
MFEHSEVTDRRWLIREDELDDEQYKIRMLKMDNYLIEGCAGSGKTILALQKAKEIQDSGAGTYLIIIYTVTLRAFIKDGITHLGLDPDRVCNYHQLEKLGYESADYIIVDEIQDFTKEQIKKMVGMANKNFLFFGDDAQQLYSHKGCLNLAKVKAITSIKDSNHKKLVKNYRLPKSVAEFAIHLKSDDKDLVGRCVKKGGEKPLVIHGTSFYEELRYIKEVIEREGWLDVAILFQNNDKVKDAFEFYKQIGFAIEAKYNRGKQSVNKLDFYTAKPKVMTYHSSKGLQFEHVFLPSCEVDTNAYNLKDALYVAITRASDNLFILYTDNLSPHIKNISNDYYDIHEIN